MGRNHEIHLPLKGEEAGKLPGYVAEELPSPPLGA